MTSRVHPKFLLLLVLILILGAMRLWMPPPLPNFSPLGAMALFGGAYFRQHLQAFFFPLAMLFVSDIYLMQYLYPEYSDGLLYSGWIWTYGAFACMVVASRVMLKKVAFWRLLLACGATAVIHWFVSDMGVWLAGGMDPGYGKPYTRDLEGFLRCYYFALPFMRNFFFGTVVYASVMFGTFEWMRYKYPRLALQTSA